MACMVLCLLLLSLHRQLVAALLSNWGYVRLSKEIVDKGAELPLCFLCSTPNGADAPVSQVQLFARAAAWNPASTSAWQGLGLSYLAQGRYDQAIDSFSRTASPGSVAEFFQGAALAGNNNEAAAIQAWQSVRVGKYLLRTGVQYSEQGNPACAERFYRLAVAVDSQNPDAYYALANLYWELGKKDLNIQALEAGLAVDERPSGKRSFYQGQLAYLQESYDRAIQYYQDSLGYADRPTQVYRFLGLALWQKGDRRAAAEAFQKQIDSNNDLWARIFAGRAYLEMQECEQAIKLLGQATEQSPTTAAGWGWLGIAHLSCGSARQAIPALSKAVTLDSQNPSYHKALADAYRLSGQMDLACQEYAKALGLKPTDETRRIMEELQCPRR